MVLIRLYITTDRRWDGLAIVVDWLTVTQYIHIYMVFLMNFYYGLSEVFIPERKRNWPIDSWHDELSSLELL